MTEQTAAQVEKFIVNKSTGYELRGVVHPVDAEVELPEDFAADDVGRGFLVPKSPKKTNTATAAPAAAAPDSPASVSVPIVTTQKMQADLRARDFTQDQIDAMTPQQAHDELAK